MEQTSESLEPWYPLNVQPSAILDGLKIMEALSNRDAVNLFFYAEKGITSSTEAIKTLGLTQKRYYTRLKLLLDAGLIEKTNEGYRHTFMGRLVHKLGLSLINIVENKEQLDVLNSISKEKNLSPEQTSQIAQVLSIDELIGDMVSRIKIVDTFEKAVYNVINFVDNAENSIYFASKYVDIRVSEACMKAMQRGIDTYFIVGNQNQFSNALKLIWSIITNPAQIKMIYEYLKSPEFKIRYIEIPYTFLVVDEKNSMIEIPKPFSNDFSLSIFFSNETFSKKLIENFNLLWENASEVRA